MRINFLKKVVVGGLITSLCLCCCFLNFNKNVNANNINVGINNIPSFYLDNFYDVSKYDEIQNLNDLKGTIWIPNFDFTYEHISYNTIYVLSFTKFSNDFFKHPFVMQKRLFNFYVQGGEYLYNDNNENNLLSLNPQNSLTFAPFGNNGFCLYSSVCGYELINNESETNIITNNIYYDTTAFITANSLLTGAPYVPLYFDMGFIQDYSNPNFDVITSNYPFIFFPNGDYELSLLTDNESTFLTFFKDNFTFIIPQDLYYYSDLGDYDRGYAEGYNVGFSNGQISGSNGEYRFSFLTGILNAISDVLALEIFPNVRLGYFVLIPLALGVTGMIFWFWRKD